MSDIEPTRRPFQYSLWSLFVLTTLVSVLCSILVCTNWAVPVVIIVGIGTCLVGFGKLSFRKHPTAGIAFAVAGFVVRFVGLAIISFGLILWFASVGRR
jgi:hypothetical protein